ncbi:MAG: glycosyl transferase, family 2 [Candidatus Saccharibacteria bacterium]|nr:glycosyl transferase, family 2 [Candidatus Saccharibacteria bacterium]
MSIKNIKKPLISIIALNWNGKKFIDPLVESVKNQQLKDISIEFLFVDNDSSDDSAQYFKEKYEDEQYRLILNGGNYGYAKGNNLGMLKAKGDYILVCNNDLILDKDLVQNLYEAAIEKKADITVPKLMFLNKPGYINNAGSSLDRNNSWPVTEIGLNEKDTGQYEEIREITAFCGACALFTREFLETVGMYDDKFFMYFEDSDLSWRGQDAGRKFYYAPKAIAHHHHTGTSVEGSPKFNHYVARNRVLVLMKNASLRVILVGYKFAIKDHVINRIKNIIKALLGRYPKKVALKEFARGIKTFIAIITYTPYALFKRWRIVKESTI